MELTWSRHALERMAERNVSKVAVELVVANGTLKSSKNVGMEHVNVLEWKGVRVVVDPTRGNKVVTVVRMGR